MRSLFDVLSDRKTAPEIVALKVLCAGVYVAIVAGAFSVHWLAGLAALWIGLYVAPLVGGFLAVALLALPGILMILVPVAVIVVLGLWYLSGRG